MRSIVFVPIQPPQVEPRSHHCRAPFPRPPRSRSVETLEEEEEESEEKRRRRRRRRRGWGATSIACASRASSGGARRSRRRRWGRRSRPTPKAAPPWAPPSCGGSSGRCRARAPAPAMQTLSGSSEGCADALTSPSPWWRSRTSTRTSSPTSSTPRSDPRLVARSIPSPSAIRSPFGIDSFSSMLSSSIFGLSFLLEHAF